MNEVLLDELDLQLASHSGEGMKLEACNPLRKSDVVVFSSKVEGRILVEIYNGKEIIVFPLEELERAISVAKQEVHSESFYD